MSAAARPLASTRPLRAAPAAFARPAHAAQAAPVFRAGQGCACGGGCARCRQHKNDAAAPAAAPPATAAADRRLLTFAGDATLDEVFNRRRLLGQGSSGDAVRRLQQALLDEGYALPRFGADGRYGGETAAAVREFQSRWRMQVDGVVGDQTIGLLDRHRLDKGLLAAGESAPLVGGLLKGAATHDLDQSEADHRKTACPAADSAERLTVAVQPVVIAEDDGSAPTAAIALTAAQKIWEQCCINLSEVGTKVISRTAFKTLDESPNDVPTAEETALFATAGASAAIQVFVPELLQQGATIGKDVSGGGGTYSAGTAHPKIVLVEGAAPEVLAHEIGHAMGAGHDAADTVMKPTGKHDVANSQHVSPAVCASVRGGPVLARTSGAADCCMRQS